MGGGFGNRSGGPRPRWGGRKPAVEMTPSVEKERVSNYDPNKKNYVRQHDPERVARNRKQLARENFNGWMMMCARRPPCAREEAQRAAAHGPHQD